MIRITGYITETRGKNGFTIKITEDDFEDEKGKHPEESKEARITISRHLYPHNTANRFVKAEGSQVDQIKRYMSISEGLKKGDMVKCYVYVVEEDRDINNTTYKIKVRDDILSYAESNPWLCPGDTLFSRLDVDTPQSLKFRKQNYYMDRNKEKCEKITGVSYQFEKNKWLYKNPKLLFLRFLMIRIKTKVTDLWGYLSAKNLTILSIILTVALALLGIVVTIIVGIVGIIF